MCVVLTQRSPFCVACAPLLDCRCVDARDAVGATALHHAVSHGKLKVMQALLKAGANVNATADKATVSFKTGSTPLHYAGAFIVKHALCAFVLLVDLVGCFLCRCCMRIVSHACACVCVHHFLLPWLCVLLIDLTCTLLPFGSNQRALGECLASVPCVSMAPMSMPETQRAQHL